MNLLQLQKRINDVVAENNLRPDGAMRNELPVIIELPNRTPKGRRGKSEYRPVDYFSNAVYGLGVHGKFTHLVAKAEGFKLSDNKVV